MSASYSYPVSQLLTLGQFFEDVHWTAESWRRIYRKAKSDKTHRFWGLFVHIAKSETLDEAYRIAKRNGGAPGIDDLSFADIEASGRTVFLAEIQADL